MQKPKWKVLQYWTTFIILFLYAVSYRARLYHGKDIHFVLIIHAIMASQANFIPGDVLPCPLIPQSHHQAWHWLSVREMPGLANLSQRVSGCAIQIPNTLESSLSDWSFKLSVDNKGFKQHAFITIFIEAGWQDLVPHIGLQQWAF